MVTISLFQAHHPYIGGAGTPTSAVAFNPYLNTALQTVAVTGAQTNGESPSCIVSQHHTGVIPNAFSSIPQATKLPRPDRLEVGRRALP